MTEPSTSPPPIAHLELKAALLLALLLALVGGAVAYLMYARGAFEPTQELVLVADDAEGIAVGADLTFAGFPIGRVRRIELGADGNARIVIDVPKKDAHWLRSSSVFTLVRSLLGSTNIRAYSAILTDPALPPGAERTVLHGDALAEVPQLLAAARDLVQNLNRLTAAESPLGASLANLQTLTQRLQGPGGALAVLLGNEAESRKLATALDRTNALLARVDGMAAHADAQLFGPRGLTQATQATVEETRATVLQLGGLLKEARASLVKVDAVLAEAQAVGANARVATTDLGALRLEVEANLRRVEGLVDEVNRKWPFARDTELKLP
jgi:phospholipid/cholesterol/gamma-HCH transport system substrate-binding protein